MTDTPLVMNLGGKIRKIRELRGMKQETLAAKLNISHQAVSKMEQSDTVEPEKLELVAEILGVTVEGIKTFNEDAAINFFNTVSNNQFDNQSTAMVYCQNINPIEKIVELYERLLEAERSKNDLLQRFLQNTQTEK